MNLLDENFPDDQRDLLRKFGVPVRQIGHGVYARRLLRHPQFDTIGKRMGKVLVVGPSGVKILASHREAPRTLGWTD